MSGGLHAQRIRQTVAGQQLNRRAYLPSTKARHRLPCSPTRQLGAWINRASACQTHEQTWRAVFVCGRAFRRLIRSSHNKATATSGHAKGVCDRDEAKRSWSYPHRRRDGLCECGGRGSSDNPCLKKQGHRMPSSSPKRRLSARLCRVCGTTPGPRRRWISDVTGNCLEAGCAAFFCSSWRAKRRRVYGTWGQRIASIFCPCVVLLYTPRRFCATG